jgi:2-polyprenyl-6-methoxyphenol hydroxylase-like FAD-dependent oxidoreductase
LPISWSQTAVFCTSLLGREITRIDRCFGMDLTGSDLVAEPGQQVPQPCVEQILRDAVLASEFAGLYTGVRVTGVEQSSEEVVVTIVDRDGDEQRVRASWVVGCDGAQSVVRDAIGAKYQGSEANSPNFNMVFRAPGLAERVPHGPAIHYWILNPKRPGLVGRLDLEGTWWCGAQGVDSETGEATAKEIIRDLVGADIDVEVLGTDAWRAQMLISDSYGSGRLFVAGDAAHQNPPWGGHGFNTGVGDAVNIGWKLAAVVNGWAPPRILETYEIERRPVAVRTLNEAIQNMRTLARELADPRLAGSDAEFDEARGPAAEAIQAAKDSEFHSLGLTLGYDYCESPLVIADDTPEPPPPEGTVDGYTPSTAPGKRLRHRWLTPTESLYDRLGPEYTLMGDLSAPGAPPLAAAAGALSVPLELAELSEADWRLFGAPLVLVRPDQHVAWRGADPSDPAQIVRRAVGAGPSDPPDYA